PARAGARPPAYGNPSQHRGRGTGGSPAGGEADYLADPLGVSQAPQYAEPASPAYQALPDLGMTGPVPYADGHAQYAYPDRAAYPDGYANGGDPPPPQTGYPRGPPPRRRGRARPAHRVHP